MSLKDSNTKLALRINKILYELIIRPSPDTLLQAGHFWQKEAGKIGTECKEVGLVQGNSCEGGLQIAYIQAWPFRLLPCDVGQIF